MPQAQFVSRFILEKDEFLNVGGEDLQSCFNLFTMPEAWRGYMAFEKRVPWSVFGRRGGGSTLVAVTVVPMGWTASVDIIQNFLRRLVFNFNVFDPQLELVVGKPFPLSQAVLACIDGVDVVTREPTRLPRSEAGKLVSLEKFLCV